MATIKVKYRPSAIADHEGVIYYQIIHGRTPRQLSTDYHIRPEEWDRRRSSVVSVLSGERVPYIDTVRARIRHDVERLMRIVAKLDSDGLPYSAGDVIDEFNRYVREYSLFSFMEKIISRHRSNNKERTSETYRAALISFKKFRNGEDIMLDCINPEVMESFETWHRSRGNTPNTVSFYTRILRAVYNRAVEQGIIENRNPFRHVYTGVDKTVKRALPLGTIRKIKLLDLSEKPTLDYARDMFLLSFYLRGMSFVDMAFLKKSDLRNGYTVYRRRKTGQQLTIAWTPEMQVILDKYPLNPTQYLLPIIRSAGTNERCMYHNMGNYINHNLKKVAALVGIKIPLTLYVARHSWASAAKAKGIPLSVICEGMGHDNESTTQIYLASLDTSVVDRANSLIIRSL